jgi:hypothetical protein
MYSFYILLPDHKNLSVLRIGTLDVIVKTKPKEVKHTWCDLNTVVISYLSEHLVLAFYKIHFVFPF